MLSFVKASFSVLMCYFFIKLLNISLLEISGKCWKQLEKNTLVVFLNSGVKNTCVKCLRICIAYFDSFIFFRGVA